MTRLPSILGALLVVFLAIPVLRAWSADANVLELEVARKTAAQRAEWTSDAPISKEDLPGFYRYSPGDWNAFWLKSDGTGLLYGGQRGVGVWQIAWDYHEHEKVIVFRSVQLARQYKPIKKDGKIYMVEGREVWRQHVSFNAAIPQPKDKVLRVADEPPAKLQKIP